MGGLFGRLPRCWRGLTLIQLQQQSIYGQRGLLLMQHCDPQSRRRNGQGNCIRRNRPQDGQTPVKSPRAFLPPFLLCNMGPDGEDILLGTSHSHSSTLMYAEFHLTSDQQKLLPGITVCPLSSCKSCPGQRCSSPLRLCGPFPSHSGPGSS